jgi:hypothetical protein
MNALSGMNILWLFIGSAIGLVVGVLPVLGAAFGVALALPFTFGIMDHPHTMAAPPGLPPEIRRSWEDIFSKIFKDPEWGAKMEKLGYPPSPMIEKDKLDAQIEAIMKKMDNYKDIISMLGLK